MSVAVSCGGATAVQRIQASTQIVILKNESWAEKNWILTSFFRDEDWEDNDGALNTIAMTHPWLPVEHPSHLVVDDSKCHPLRPGIW